MTPQMQTALWISAVGAAILFGALACVVGFMYLLTAPWFGSSHKRGEAEAESAPDASESERRRKAVAVAIASAWAAAQELPSLDEPASDWRRVHLTRQFQRSPRRGA